MEIDFISIVKAFSKGLVKLYGEYYRNRYLKALLQLAEADELIAKYEEIKKTSHNPLPYQIVLVILYFLRKGSQKTVDREKKMWERTVLSNL